MAGAAAAAVGMGIESAPGPGVLRIELPELKPEAKELVASTLALSDKDDSSAKMIIASLLVLTQRRSKGNANGIFIGANLHLCVICLFILSFSNVTCIS